jgi:hypothetical protein
MMHRIAVMFASYAHDAIIALPFASGNRRSDLDGHGRCDRVRMKVEAMLRGRIICPFSAWTPAARSSRRERHPLLKRPGPRLRNDC